MNPLNAYRNSVYTTPFHVQLSQLHRRAGILTRDVARYVESGDVQGARSCIQEIEEIIAFLRSSLDMTLEASEKADAVYAFYYGVMTRWFLDPSSYSDELNDVLEFWDSWAETWQKVTIR